MSKTKETKQLYLMITNVPETKSGQKTNWEPFETEAMKQHNTVDDRLWWADYDREKLVKIREEFKKRIPNPIPPVKFSIRKVKKIPSGYE